jgi:hypothetical protein
MPTLLPILDMVLDSIKDDTGMQQWAAREAWFMENIAACADSPDRDEGVWIWVPENSREGWEAAIKTNNIGRNHFKAMQQHVAASSDMSSASATGSGGLMDEVKAMFVDLMQAAAAGISEAVSLTAGKGRSSEAVPAKTFRFRRCGAPAFTAAFKDGESLFDHLRRVRNPEQACKDAVALEITAIEVKGGQAVEELERITIEDSKHQPAADFLDETLYPSRTFRIVTQPLDDK